MKTILKYKTIDVSAQFVFFAIMAIPSGETRWQWAMPEKYIKCDKNYVDDETFTHMLFVIEKLEHLASTGTIDMYRHNNDCVRVIINKSYTQSYFTKDYKYTKDLYLAIFNDISS